MITKNDILTKLTEEEIICKYFPEEVSLKKKYCSPYRIDNDPNCEFRIDNKNGLIFTDWSLHKTYDCFDICKEYLKKNNKSYDFRSILEQIDADFKLGISPTGLETTFIGPKRKKITRMQDIKKTNKEIKFYPVIRNTYEDYELEYWTQYGISLEVLNIFNVHSCVQLSVEYTNEQGYKGRDIYASLRHNPIFVYLLEKGSQYYKPYANIKNNRFIQDFPSGYLMGLSNLPDSGENLIITSSYKDVMIYYILGIPAVCPIGEHAAINAELLADLISRFDNIYVNFNNDTAGITNAMSLVAKYPEFTAFFIKDSKDPADYIKEVSIYYHDKTDKKLEAFNDLLNYLEHDIGIIRANDSSGLVYTD